MLSQHIIDRLQPYGLSSDFYSRQSHIEICRDYASCTWDLNLEPGKHKRDYEQGCPRHANCRSVIGVPVGVELTLAQIMHIDRSRRGAGFDKPVELEVKPARRRKLMR